MFIVIATNSPLINTQNISRTSIALLNLLSIDQHILLGTYLFSRNMHICSARSTLLHACMHAHTPRAYSYTTFRLHSSAETNGTIEKK